MSRLIDATTLRAEFTGNFQEMWHYTGIWAMIDIAPTIDAVPVVRCKNCKHWGTGAPGETEHVKCCEYGRYMVGESGYCVYGELRTSAK